MSIINKGIFDTDTAFQRLIGEDWPTQGQISAVIVSDSTTIISTGNTSYNIGTVVTDPKRIMVLVEGVTQIPITDYTTNGSTLNLIGTPAVGANIEIKFFGTDTINSSVSLYTKVDSFVGTGANTAYTLSVIPPNKNHVSVIVNGVYQHSDTYTLIGKTLALTQAPAAGANVDVRIVSGKTGSSFNTRTYTGTGSANTFALTEGFTVDTILVFENGVAQVPVTDYNVVNNNLVFATPPAANINIQVRELGISASSGANVATSLTGYNLTAGNIIPVSSLRYLGNPTYKWEKIYLQANGLILNDSTIGAVGTTLSITNGNTTTQFATAAGVSAKAFGLSLIFGG
jgi:hypothetical protein